MSPRRLAFAVAASAAVVSPLDAQQADLRYTAAPTRTVSYTTVDTTDMNLSTGMTVSARMHSLVSLKLVAGDNGLVAQGELKELTGMSTSPMGEMPVPAPPADARSIALQMNAAGVKADDPANYANMVPGADGSGLMAQSRAAALLLTVPGRSVRMGETWVDTVLIDSEVQGIKMKGTTIINGTYRADTTVNGRKLNVVVLDAVTSLNSSGVMQGSPFDQTIESNAVTRLLWDSARHLPASHTTTGTTKIDVSVAGMTMNMQGKTRSHSREAESGGA